MASAVLKQGNVFFARHQLFYIVPLQHAFAHKETSILQSYRSFGSEVTIRGEIFKGDGLADGSQLPYSIHRYKRLVQAAFDETSHVSEAAADPLSEQLARRTLAHAQLQRGQRILDIATGTGSLLVLAARAVGNTGRVLGLDVSRGMVEQARRTIQAARLANAEVRQADAEAAELPRAAFDVALCSGSLPYMRAAAPALARWRAWLRPSGRLVVNSYKDPFDPECGIFYRLAQDHGLAHLFADPLAAMGSKQACAELLERAGYRRVQVTEESCEMLAAASSARAYAEAMWASSVSSPHHHLDTILRAAAGTPGHEPQLTTREGGGTAVGGAQGWMAGPSRGSGPKAVRRGAAAQPLSPPQHASAARLGGKPWGAALGPRQQPSPESAPGQTPQAATALSVGVTDARATEPASGCDPAALQQQFARHHQQQILQQQQQQQPSHSQHSEAPSTVAVSRAGPGAGESGRQLDLPAAVAAFRQEFLDAAERSVQGRLRSGVVRTRIGVLYCVGHAS